MKSKHKLLFLIVIIALLVIPTIVGAAPPPEENVYRVDWWTVGGGGGDSTDGSYNLKGTIGQPAAGNLQVGDIRLQGGYWVRGILEIVTFIINLPLILK